MAKRYSTSIIDNTKDLKIAYGRKYMSLDSMSTGRNILNEDYGFSIYPSYILLLA